jgi:hypothetical protein
MTWALEATARRADQSGRQARRREAGRRRQESGAICSGTGPMAAFWGF